MSSEARNALRAKIFSAKSTSKFVPIGEPVEGQEPELVEVRQTSVGDMLDSISAEGMRQRIAHMMIATCYVPNTDEHIFEPEDFDSLMALPANGTYAGLIEAITDNMNAKVQETEAKKS